MPQDAAGTILARLQERRPRRWGVGSAAAYVRQMERHATDHEAFKQVMERAERQAVYCDAETLIKGHRLKDAEDPDPAKPLMVFDATITTTQRDRDGDILESKGARPDMDGPLLLNHDYSLVLGKPLKAVKHNSKRYVEKLAIVNSPDPKSPLGLLARDVATLIDFGALRRMSHGFMPDETTDEDDPAYEPMLDKEGEFLGWHIFRYEIWERSIVAVASNTSAFITAFSRGKLASPMVKSWGSELFDARPVVVPAAKAADQADSPQDVVSVVDDDVVSQTDTTEVDAEPKPVPLLNDERSGGTHAVPRVLRFTRPTTKSGESTFDVWREHLEPAQLEYDWVSRYIGCQVKHLFWVTTSVPCARIGSWLTGLREVLGEYKVEDTRNIGYDGTEYPPKYEIIQLTPDKSEDFMVDGLEFRVGQDRKFAVKVEPFYGTLEVTFYTSNKTEHKQFARKTIADTWEWSRVHNFLRGQAFSLTGGFLSKTEETWDGLFLPKRNKAPVMRAVGTVNDKGASGPNRGMILTGPPGTGKTLSARVMLNAAKGTFIWVSARDFWRCGSYHAFTHAFDLARELAPTIVCFDDVDTWLDRRGGTEDLLKSEMDGMGRSSGVLTLLISNYPENIPDALIDRPGRFHDVLLYDVPSSDTRGAMLAAWLPEANDKSRGKAVAETDGYSGAHIYELCKYARTIDSEDECGLDKALTKALEKIAEQREIIDGVQLEGSHYKPRARAALQMDKSVGFGNTVERKAADEKTIPSNPPGGGGEGVEGEWTRLKLSDFTDKQWGDLSASQKATISKYFAWYTPADTFDASCHLGHHFPPGHANAGNASINGVNNAKARANQVAGLSGGDLERVMAHLTAHQPKKAASDPMGALAGCKYVRVESLDQYTIAIGADTAEELERLWAKATDSYDAAAGDKSKQTHAGNSGKERGLLGALRRIGGIVRR